MSLTQSPPPLAGKPPVTSRWRRLDHWLARSGDHLNPILVKEARAALKSKQFVLTFGLELLACWAWSVIGLMLIGPGVDYTEPGKYMYFGYYAIMTFPLLVIVPYGAYRSLAAERDDRTHELVSITGLSAWQVVCGKLSSAALEIVVYLSAVLPCMTFAYLLRGIDFASIAFTVFHTVVASLALTIVGLAAATISKERFGQVIIAVLLIVGTIGAFAGALSMVAALLVEINISQVLEESEFWIGNGIALSIVGSYAALLLLIAAGQLAFASSNRASGIRVVALAQQVLFVGWAAWGWIYTGPMFDGRLLCVLLPFMGVHWYVMGVFMTAESGDLSPRVRRSLPSTFIGRMLRTWFNPGPSTGYVFVVASLTAALLLANFVQSWKLELRGGQTALAPPGMTGVPGGGGLPVLFWDVRIAPLALVIWGYVAFFVGLGKLLIAGLRRMAPVGLAIGFVVQILLLLACTGVPLLIQFSSPTLRFLDYTLLQISNPFWTLAELIARPMPSLYQASLMTWVPLAGGIVFLLNVPGIAQELRYVRLDRPERVVQEDALLAEQLKPVAAAPIDPLA